MLNLPAGIRSRVVANLSVLACLFLMASCADDFGFGSSKDAEDNCRTNVLGCSSSDSYSCTASPICYATQTGCLESGYCDDSFSSSSSAGDAAEGNNGATSSEGNSGPMVKRASISFYLDPEMHDNCDFTTFRVEGTGNGGTIDFVGYDGDYDVPIIPYSSPPGCGALGTILLEDIEWKTGWHPITVRNRCANTGLQQKGLLYLKEDGDCYEYGI